MWTINRKSSERYGKLLRLIKSMGSHFELTEDKEGSLRLIFPNYNGKKTMNVHIVRLFPLIIFFLSNSVVYAQRYSGYGRGMDSGDDWDFSPGFKLLFFLVLIGICVIGGLIGLFKEKLGARKENATKESFDQKYKPSQNATFNERRVGSLQKRSNKPSSSHYQAALIAMLIAIALGLYIYNSNFVRLDQDRTLFSCVCFVLAIIVWGYPYFDTSVTVDNDGCFEQGCIHPIIGVFGLLLLPLFLHYWLYKGIKACIVLIKSHLIQK